MSGGGGGTIIIRTAIKQALMHPLVHGALPVHMRNAIDPILEKNVDLWSEQEDRTASAIFHWANAHR